MKTITLRIKKVEWQSWCKAADDCMEYWKIKPSKDWSAQIIVCWLANHGRNAVEENNQAPSILKSKPGSRMA